MTAGVGPPDALCAERLRVTFGNVVALADASIRVAAGELVALLGPSGSGKTTLLHAAAGFLEPDAGQLWIGGRLVAGAGHRTVPTERRRIGLVFQGYALWPHMAVLETVAYPLERQGIPRGAARTRARELLERLELAHLADRRPAQLSGGQQQRVGLARALATAPELFLFDEPTANLDASLKAAFQDETARQLRDTGAGALYVTHDPTEAFAVADRVVVLHDGRVAQEGPPEDVYARPADRWVAGLTGSYTTLPATVQKWPASEADAALLRIGAHEVRCPADSHPLLSACLPDSPVEALFRPEWVHLDSPSGVPARVAGVRFQGAHTDYLLDSMVGKVAARCAGPPTRRAGEAACWLPSRAWLLPAAGAAMPTVAIGVAVA